VRSTRESLREYCSDQHRSELLEQWHPKKNGGLTPDDVSYGSQKKIWWQCDAGHEWQSAVYARAEKNSGCPYCAGRRVVPGRDLESLYPDLAQQWHRELNGKAGPDQFAPGSHKAAWWQCNSGHVWKATIKSRTEGSGCPVCSRRKVVPGVNDLKSMAPELAKQWHPSKNGSLTPEQVVCGSSRKVWWRCRQGHEWQAEIHSRVMGRGCPVCAGKAVLSGVNDLESYAPELAKQWHPTKNRPLLPSEVSVSSNRRVWWRCDAGHEWEAVISSRTANRSECPYCTNRRVLSGFNDLKTVQPLVAAQWHPTLNESLEPTMVLPGSRKRVWWQCSDGHEWKAIIYSRTGADKCGCPVCAGKTAKRTGI